MKIGIDITPATKDKAGVGYFTFSMIQALAEIDKENQYELFTNDANYQLESLLPQNFKITLIEDSKPGVAWMFKGARYLKANHFDFFISTSYLLWSILYPKTIQIIHDIAPVKYPQFFTKKGSAIYNLQLRLALVKAQHVVTISKTVLNELLKINNKNNKDFILLGLHKWAFDQKNAEYYKNIKLKYNLPQKYFVYIATLEPRKNHIKLLQGFKLFLQEKQDYKLVIVGKKGWFYTKIFDEVKSLNLENNVIFTGYALEEDLAGLIDLSSGGLQLSIYEGFGLPIIEYTARKKAVLASNIPVFNEVAENLTNVIFCNQNNPEDIKSGLDKLSKHPIVTENLNIKNYSWNSFSAKLLEIIRDIQQKESNFN